MNYHKNQTSQRKSLRLTKFDYSQCGYYYVTICTEDRASRFGFVRNGTVILNPMGKIANNMWRSIPKYYSNVDLDEYVIMPNHIHGIIVILEDESRTGHYPVPTTPRYGLLSKIINGYKNAVTKEIKNNKIEINFAWQRSYFDHIIRNEKDHIRIRQYIKNNPLRWPLDEYYNQWNENHAY